MKRSILIVLLCIVVLGAVGASIWWYIHFRGGPTAVTDTTTQPIEIPVWYYTDKDGDLISDEKEKELGTSPNETDTDGDSVSDYDEVNKYKTDPIKTDTDGDGFPDGLEIIQGHDPLKAISNQ